MNTRRSLLKLSLLVCAVSLARWSFAVAQDKGDTKSLEGKSAPDFELKTLDGKSLKLSEQKGSVVLMDFWATWCPPCRESLPHVEKMSKDPTLSSKGLKVWAVNAREKTDKIEPFLKQNSYTFTVPMDADGKVMQDYLIRGIPTTVIVGRDGTIRKVFIGFGGEESAKQIHDAVEAALKDPAAAT